MRRRLPRVGLTTYREPAEWGVWSESADLLPATYAAAVRDAGAVALLLPPDRREHAASVLDGLDGLVLSGGADIDPERYGAEADASTGPPRPDRDEWELALAHAALARDVPLLAICRGMQVLNVALGGDLRQHLPDNVGSELHRPTVGVHGRHDVTAAPSSALARIVGATASVPTYHHQGLDRLGTDLVATGWAEDGVVEAVELPGRRWVLGVQWHPEVADGAPLFTAFVDACRAA